MIWCEQIKALEKEFPELVTRDSLTQKVGGHVKEGFKQVVHEVPLQSLQDIFSFEELRDFDTRVRKVAEENNEELKYVVEQRLTVYLQRLSMKMVFLYKVQHVEMAWLEKM